MVAVPESGAGFTMPPSVLAGGLTTPSDLSSLSLRLEPEPLGESADNGGFCFSGMVSSGRGEPGGTGGGIICGWVDGGCVVCANASPMTSPASIPTARASEKRLRLNDIVASLSVSKIFLKGRF